MRHFATESGKSKGQFYTPSEVSRIMAKVIGIGPATRQDQTIYDPTCGSGSLLIKAADEAPRGITIYGQEMDNATYALARMNMILHGHPTAELWRDNTLAAPYYKQADNRLMTFDFAVANPPFSAKAWSTGLNPQSDPFDRFFYGVPPTKNGDYAFLLHLITSLKSTGKGAIILPHGVLFRGNKEADIRRTLVRRGLIKGIIGLPPNLFYGTGIPACIIVIDKEHARVRSGIFMIDASRGFIKDGNKNRLRAQDIHRIVDVFTRQIELPRYSRMVPVAEIASPANDYNLNIPRYIDASEPEDLHDLQAHLSGGIPNRDIDALQAYWAVCPTLRQTLFAADGRAGYSTPLVATEQVKPTILSHPEFSAYTARVTAVFEAWRVAHRSRLLSIKINDLPRELIATLAEDLLSRFAELPLLSQYAAYQRLMDYWADVMQDDVYLIAADGWLAAARPRPIIDDNERKIKETPDLVIGRKKYKMDLLPPALIVARYFAAEQAALERLQLQQETAARELEEFVEEHSGEDGPLADAVSDKGRVSKGSVKERLKQVRMDAILAALEADDAAELETLERCLRLLDAEADAARAVREAEAARDQRVLEQYPQLSEAEIKALVVDDKWLPAIWAGIESEVQRLTQQLAGRVRELEERYTRPLPDLERNVEMLSARVEAHLKQMGLTWV